MSEPRRIILVGASGMIGRAVMARAVGRSDVRLLAIGRREAPLPRGAQMEQMVAPVASWPDLIAQAGAATLVIALGTTIRAVGGDKAAFRAVDHDLVLATARAAEAAGVRQVIAVSSVGADPDSGNFYLRTKGEVERGLNGLGLNRVDLLRPGLLMGQRPGPVRPGERVGMILAPLTDLLLHGKWRRFRSIRADTVADAILSLAGEATPGRAILEHDALLSAAAGQFRG